MRRPAFFQHERLLLFHSGDIGPGGRLFHLRAGAGKDFPAGRLPANSRRGLYGRRGLCGHAALARFSHPAAEHCRAGAYFRRRHGRAVWPGRTPVDRFRLHSGRNGARLLFRHDFPAAQGGKPAGNPGALPGQAGPVDQPRRLHRVQRAGGRRLRRGARRHPVPHDGLERFGMGLDDLRLLLSGDHSSHPGYHGKGLSSFFGRPDHHGHGHSGRDAPGSLCGFHAGLDAPAPHGSASGSGLFP